MIRTLHFIIYTYAYLLSAKIKEEKKLATILWRNTRKLMSNIVRRFLFPPVIQKKKKKKEDSPLN